MAGAQIALMVFPWPWPVRGTVRILKLEGGDEVVQVFATPFGRLLIRLIRNGQRILDWKSQTIRIDGVYKGVMAVLWDERTIRLQLNSVEVLSWAEAGQKEFVLQGVPIQEIASNQPIFFGLRDIRPKDETQDFFIRTISDIQDKILTGDRYELIRAAGLLRQLLLDEFPLIHKINRTFRQDIIFRVLADPGPPPVADFNLYQLGLDPSDWPQMETADLDRKKFRVFRNSCG